jgi:hypothetical protein
LSSDKIKWRARWKIHRFRDPTGEIESMLKSGMSLENVVMEFPDLFIDIEEFESNVALNEGLQELIDIICGMGTPTKWDNSNARLGVGNSSASENASQTGLQGESKAFKSMDGGYPQKASQTVEWRATFGSDEGNFAWEEYTVVNAADDTGKNLNRKTASKGTKVSGETWTLSLKITFS